MMSENMTSPMSNLATKEQQNSMSDIETSVSRLLMTTKKLLETLTAWSAGNASDTQVYDEYNALEIHFAGATHAFETVLLPMEDMLHLPDNLYACLKNTLSKEPCSTTLEQHLPEIRDSILKLLQGLKTKQSLLRERFEPTSATSKLMTLAKQQQLSPIATQPLPLPSPTSSAEPTQENEKTDMSDQKDTVQASRHGKDLSGRSSITMRKKTKLTSVVTLYLKAEDRVKKINFDQSKLKSIQDVKQLFVDKFTLNEQIDQITILDRESNIEYELEDLQDIKPYTILSAQQDPLYNSEMKLLFRETVQQVLHTMQSSATVDLNRDIPQSTNQNLEQQNEQVNLLRTELASARKAYADYKQETESVIKQLQEQIKQPPLTPAVVLDTDAREEMSDDREGLHKAGTLITNRLEVLQDTIDRIKTDVTQRRCRPSKAQMDHCRTESELLREEMTSLSTRIKTLKPTWKKMWEVQLQQIVKEQQFLKEQESLIIDLKEDHSALDKVLEQLNKILEIQERKKLSGQMYQVAPIEEGSEGMVSVMKQVSTIHVDHSRRVQALEEAEKSRSKELSQRIDAFERELTDFVGLKKLRKTGGAKAIEQQRQEKQQDLIKSICNSSTNITNNEHIEEKDTTESSCASPLINEDETNRVIKKEVLPSPEENNDDGL